MSGSHGKPDGGGRKWDEDGKVDKDEMPWIEDAAECAHICVMAYILYICIVSIQVSDRHSLTVATKGRPGPGAHVRD